MTCSRQDFLHFPRVAKLAIAEKTAYLEIGRRDPLRSVGMAPDQPVDPHQIIFVDIHEGVHFRESEANVRATFGGSAARRCHWNAAG